MIEPNELYKLLRYEPETGILTWRVTSSNRAVIGTVAGYTKCLGYRLVRVKGERIRAHRIVWAMVHGEWPAYDIDHINGNPSDNRIVNLREATKSQNQHNRSKQRNNSSGFKGVVKQSPNRWGAYIWVDGSAKYLGLFASPELAHEAYKAAAHRLHGKFARTD